MDNWQLALLAKPFVALFLFGCFGLPAKILVQKYMKDCRLKRLLLTKIS